MFQQQGHLSLSRTAGDQMVEWGTFVAGPGGSKSYSVTVDESTNVTKTPKSGTCSTDINMECNTLTQPLEPWITVDDAYTWVSSSSTPSHPVDPITIGWLTGQERAGINVKVNSRATPGDDTSPVTSTPSPSRASTT